MRVAFYAPMKPPDHPVPSGDRRMARLLIRALRRAGHTVDVASRLRSYDRNGDPAHQHRIRQRGARLADRLVAHRERTRPDLWFTYHLYHKAPDWIGPAVAEALSIPYVVADASIAPKQANGPWAEGYRAANAAIRRADRLIAFDPSDIPCVERHLETPGRLVAMLPFLDIPRQRGDSAASHRKQALRESLAVAHKIDSRATWLVTVAMMRRDAKLESYRVLSRARHQFGDRPWSLLVAGDGPARRTVEDLFAGDPRVRFLGRLGEPDIRQLQRAADIAVWPGVREGFSMALVEAQTAGIPVIAGDRPAIAQIVRHGETGLLTPVGDGDALGHAVRRLISQPAKRAAMARAARRGACDRLDLNAAARRLDAVLRTVTRKAAA